MFQRFETNKSCNADRSGFEGLFTMRGGPFSKGFAGRGFGGKGGPGGGRGFGDDGEGRIGRFLMQGDLRLVVLALIEKEARHGYEIIKHIEDMTYGFYAPSPGVIYPTLTYLEEAGYVTAEADGNKKRYTITDEGRAHLDENRSFATTILERLSELAEKIKQKQERHEHHRDHDKGPHHDRGPALPRSVEAALLNLREVSARRIEQNDKAAGDLVRQLLDFAEKLERDGGDPQA
ncbi:PadR family transcriptional regulator [Neorhizobium sp. AL 9.2.2]|uniref:PadR family transcriptional regulator n=1 Tax=Neorhizobium sp. AL 9.2.2 TaxID=2712894 RepID=UPI001573C7BE|nr:PadR family transcriptional regulator [Neorhizobium sp. AL 9.2.2]NSY18331.1 PadR family transcriptional regulator [Neorhizobium sp. AL 9.2.2]